MSDFDEMFFIDFISIREKIIRFLSIMIFIIPLFTVPTIIPKIIANNSAYYAEYMKNTGFLQFLIITFILAFFTFLSVKLFFSYEDYLVVEIPENVIWLYSKVFSIERKIFYSSISDIKKISLTSRRYSEKGKKKCYYYISFTGVIYFKNNKRIQTENIDEIIMPVKESVKRIGLLELQRLLPLMQKLLALTETAECPVDIDISRLPSALDLSSGEDIEIIKDIFLGESYKRLLGICPLCKELIDSSLPNCSYCKANLSGRNLSD